MTLWSRLWSDSVAMRRRKASPQNYSMLNAPVPNVSWQWPAAWTTAHGMDTAPLPAGSAPVSRAETEADRQRRLAWEATMIAEADADIAAGRLVDAAEVDAWIDSLGTDHELPVPYSGR
jgi:hypothetical protein